MPLSLDQSIFAWVKTTLSGVGSVVRQGFDPSQSNIEPPRIVFLDFHESIETIGSARKYTGIVAVRVDVNRTDAFGTGDTPEAAGDLHNLLDSVDALLADVVPTITGFACQGLTPLRDSPGDGTPDVAARTLRYSFSATTGFAGVPLSGGEGSLTITGYNGVVQWWRVNDRAPLNADMTAYDSANPQYELGDATAMGVIRFLPQENDVPFPALGATACVFTVHDGATWADEIKIHDRQWSMKPESNELVTMDMQFVIDNAASPFLTGVIP